MSEILSRWSRKPLSQILYILSGIMLMILLCNYYTAINIQVDFLDFISLDYNNLKEILYLIFDYPHKYYTFKHFEV